MTSTWQTSPACVDINNYFKVYRNQIFPFNDQSDLSLSRALNLASVLSRGGKIVVWKRFLGMPDFLQVVGEPDGGADDYPDEDEEDEREAKNALSLDTSPNPKASNGAMG